MSRSDLSFQYLFLGSKQHAFIARYVIRSACAILNLGGEVLRVAAPPPARAGNRRFRPLRALRAHTKAPYKMDFYREDAKGA